jgi:hypothetical protein
MFVCLSVQAHEAPVDHLERELSMWIKDGKLWLSYRVQLPERAVMMQLHAMDKNRDGAVNDSERENYFERRASSIGSLLRISFGEAQYEMKPFGKVKLDPTFGQTYTFAIDVSQLDGREHSGVFVDLYSVKSPGAYRYFPLPGATRLKVGNTEDKGGFQNHPDRIVLNLKLDLRK